MKIRFNNFYDYSIYSINLISVIIWVSLDAGHQKDSSKPEGKSLDWYMILILISLIGLVIGFMISENFIKPEIMPTFNILFLIASIGTLLSIIIRYFMRKDKNPPEKKI
jgi:hypothetical protein